jgi:hypothetical protein
MNLFEQLVLAAANRQSLELRELTLEFLTQNATLKDIPQPGFSDPLQLAIAAGCSSCSPRAEVKQHQIGLKNSRIQRRFF